MKGSWYVEYHGLKFPIKGSWYIGYHGPSFPGVHDGTKMGVHHGITKTSSRGLIASTVFLTAIFACSLLTEALCPVVTSAVSLELWLFYKSTPPMDSKTCFEIILSVVPSTTVSGHPPCSGHCLLASVCTERIPRGERQRRNNTQATRG